MSANRITAVLVLYRVVAENSACFVSLRNALAAMPEMAAEVSLLLYDNSPDRSDVPAFPGEISYLHDEANGGVAAAYNAGLDRARANGSQWLLLLDQDTALTAAFLDELFTTVQTVPGEVAAIIPRLTQDDATHSPHLPPRLSHKALPETAAGLMQQEVSAFNSGAALRVASIDRFPERYWLDFLDHAVFHTLQASGGRVWLMRARLSHQLSTEKLGTEASLDRYRNVVLAERDYYRDYGTFSSRLFYRLRRLKQTAGQLIKVRDKRFALLSLRAATGLLGPTPPHRSSAPQAPNSAR